MPKSSDAQDSSTQAERVAEIIADHDMTQAAFAEMIGYTAAHVSHLVKGDTKLSVECAGRITDRFHVRLEWLLVGKGPKHPRSTTTVAPATTTTTIPGGGAIQTVAIKRKTEGWFCDNCDRWLLEGFDYCPGCGRPIIWPDSEEGDA